jgi:hypothetical protein
MKTWKLITIIVLATIGVALITTAAFASAHNPYRSMVPTQGNWFGMMGNWNSPAVSAPTNQPYNNGYSGPGWGCRGQETYYPSQQTATNATAALITIDQATERAKQYVTALNNPDLKVAQVEEYANNYYVQVNEKGTGNGAFELLVNKYTGNVYPEMGPNMMWNTQYTNNTGMMGLFNGMRGMMGFQRTAASTMTVTVEQAKADAQQYLTANIPGATVGDIITFHGYYTIEVLSGGSPYGMLSVNGYSGQVWYHTWHGAFVQEYTVD